MVNFIVIILASLGYIIFILKTRKSNNFTGYSVAGRSIGFMLLFASMTANYIGPGMTLGLTSNGFSSGYFYLFIAGFYGLGKIFEAIIFAPKIRKKFTNAFTLGDIIGGKESHNSKIVQIIAGLISFGLVVGLCTVMAAKAGDILNTFLGVPNIIGTSIVTILVMSYSIFGGIKSSMQTDFLQFCMFMILIPLLLVLAFSKGGIDYNNFVITSKALTNKGMMDNNTITIFGLIVTWFFGEMLIPPTISTILSSENSKTSQKALTYSGILMIIWLGMMLTLGIVTKVILPNILSDDKVLLHLGETFYPVGLFGLFTVALVGVVMSSQDALINGASVIFSRDILHQISPLDDNKSLQISRIAGVFVGILSIFFAVYIPSVLTALLFFYSVWVPAMLVSTVFSIYLEKHYWQSALSSMLLGTLSAVIWEMNTDKEKLPTIIFGLLISIFSYLLVHIFFKMKSKNTK